MTMRITRKRQDNRRKYSSFNMEEALQLVSVGKLLLWQIESTPRPVSDALKENFRRLQKFDTVLTEVGKSLIIDAIFGEVITNYDDLKIWKAMPLETDTLVGVADYLIAPDLSYLTTPLLCVAEAKRDNFVQGLAQCVVEMQACQWQNERGGKNADVYGIVTNGGTWQFYQMPLTGGIYETLQYSTNALPELLGALHYILGECAKWVPIVQSSPIATNGVIQQHER